MDRDHRRKTSLYRQKLSELPEDMGKPAVIENPSNPNEILILGAEDNHNIYVYNSTTDKFNVNRNDSLKTIDIFQTCQRFAGYEQPLSIHALKGMNPDTIIVLGTLSGNTVPFYSIFNTKLLKFARVGNKIFDNQEQDCPKVIYNVKQRRFDKRIWVYMEIMMIMMLVTSRNTRKCIIMK